MKTRCKHSENRVKTKIKPKKTMERKQEENWHIVGTISEGVAKEIGLGAKTPVWISDRIAKHILDEHPEMKTSAAATAFAHNVVSNFTSAYSQDDGTIVLAIKGASKAMVTYIKLELASENYWRVKSAHIRPNEQLDNNRKFRLVWEKEQKKKPAKRKR